MGYPPQDSWLPPRVATILVAASTASAKTRAQADYLCDGVADEVQINAAMAALVGTPGRVMLSEGVFNISAPVAFPGAAIVLEGQGMGTAINGDGLATGNHAIVISGITQVFCTVKNLQVLTTAGGGKVCHCIYIEDGANFFRIQNVTCFSSDSDGIHLEGTTIVVGEIEGCWILGADGNAINISPDPANVFQLIHIHDNVIMSVLGNGINLSDSPGHQEYIIERNFISGITGHGIDYGAATAGVDAVDQCVISNNYIVGNAGNGIRLLSDSVDNLIEGNFIRDNALYGINIGGDTCRVNRLINNKFVDNVTGQVLDLGTDTQVPTIFVPVPNPSTNIGEHPAEQLTDLVEVVSRFNFCIPADFQELVTCEAVVVPGGTGNMRRSVATNWGKIASGEAYNANTDSIAAGEVAVDADDVEGIDIALAFTAVAPGDQVGVAFTRHGDHANDTVGADCYLLGLRLRYV